MNKLLHEAPDLSSTLKTIASDIRSTPELYAALTNAAQQYFDDHGDLKGFALVSAGISSRWLDRVYHSSLRHNLNALTKFAPKNTKHLHSFMLSLPKKISDIEQLPDIIKDVGQSINSEDLRRSAKLWDMEIMKYRSHIRKLNELSKKNDEPADMVQPVKKDTAAGQQNAQVEMIIADVLKNLPSKDAHEIRTLLARSDNKLLTLQAEMQRRNLKLNESTIKRLNMYASFDLDKAMKEMTMIMESSLRKGTRNSVPGIKTWAALDNNNSPYDAYRFGVALAAAPHANMDKHGPVGGKFVSISYTDADDAIFKGAAKLMGVSSTAVGSKTSDELDSTIVKSPVAEIKKNRFGV